MSPDDLKKLSQQFVAAANVAAPASTNQAIADYSKAAFIDPVVKQGVQAGGGLAGAQGQAADAADEAARKAQIQKLSDEADPSKYQKVRKADGGFAFFDPNGKEVDINKFAAVTGSRRADILKDSENPLDQEYINDYLNMQDLASALYNGDNDTVKAFQEQNPTTKGRTPQQLMGLLIQKYPHMYGKGTYQQTFSNRNQKIFNNNPNYVGATGGLTSLAE